MKRLGRIKIVEIIFLVLIGLTPILWFKGDYLITGADINFPLEPVREFLRRTQAWDGVYQGGRDNGMNFSTLVFSGIEAFFYLFTHSIGWTERMTFVFWFMLAGFSVYFLTNIIFKDKLFLIRFSVCLFYLFNFYHLSAWAGMHIAGITSIAVLPFMFGLFIKVINGEGVFRNTILFGIFSIFSGGIWVNPPMACVFGSIFFIYFLFGLIGEKGKFTVIYRVFTLGLLYILLNSYILIPFANVLIEGSNTIDNPLKDYNVVKYMYFQSAYSSPLNVLRLMGNSEFYHRLNSGEYYFPFFEKYIVRRLFVPGSFILPILAFMGVLLNTKDRNIRFFLTIAVIGIMLGMGPHPPMNKIYPWLVSHLPGFYIFRSPWLKFGLLTMFGYSFLAGYGCLCIYEGVRRFIPWRGWNGIFIVGILGVYMFFMHSFILGQMYTPKERRKELGPLHIKVPDYVFRCGDWLDRMRPDFNVALLPEEISNLYEWGYSGIDDVLTRISDKTILYGEYKEAVNIPPLVRLYHLFVKALYLEFTYRINRLLDIMGVRYIIQRNDFRYYFYGIKDSPRFIRYRLKRQGGISHEISFGQWDIYRNTSWKEDFIYIGTTLIWCPGDIGNLIPISELIGPKFSKNSVVILDKELHGDLRDYCQKEGIYICSNPKGEDGYDGALFYKYGNLLRWKNKRMWIDKSGKYYIFMKLKPSFKELLLGVGNRVLFNGQDILGWDYKANKTEYKLDASIGGLFLDCVFDGNSREDEYVQIRNEDININLGRYPFFTIDYMLEDPVVQTIEFIFGIDFNGDRNIDGYIRGFRTSDPTIGLKRFRLDLRGIAEGRFLKQKAYNLVLIELYCHKLWGIDCTKSGLRGNYRFWIKGIRFSNIKRREMVESYNYALKWGKKDIVMKSLDITNKVKIVRINTSSIDLYRFPEIGIRYRLRGSSRVEDFRLFLRLIPKSGKGKGRRVFVWKVPEVTKYIDFRFNLMWYKDKLDLWKDYFLQDIELRLRGRGLNKDINRILSLQGIKIFRSYFTNRWDDRGVIKMPLLEISGNRLFLKDYKEGLIPKEKIISSEITLDKGWKDLRLFLDRDNFLGCQWICILPKQRYFKEEPSLNYKRISETMYEIDVEDCGRPFILVMKNNFHKDWHAYKIKDGKWAKIETHFLCNGYANGWFVDGLDKGAKIIIRYRLQDLFRLGFGISIVALIGLLILFVKGVK